MVALVTEKISDGLVFLGGTGITAGLVLFDRSTGSDIRGSIDAVLMPLMPAILSLRLMSFPLICYEAITSSNTPSDIESSFGLLS